MDAPAHGHIYEKNAQRTGLYFVIEGGEEEHHEKKSVLKKVKDKAKKLKDTISKKKHGPGEEHLRGTDEDEEEEEEEGYIEDNEREQEPEVHGAPMYETEAARDFVSTREEGPAKESLAGGLWEEDPGAPKAGTEEAVPGSYQTNVADSSSSGGPEPGVIRSFEVLSVSDQPVKEKEGEQKEGPPSHVEETSETSQPVSEEAEPERREAEEQQPHGEKNYAEKIVSATSAIVDKAAQAKEAAASAAVGSAECGKKIAETVYEKVAVTGSGVVSTVSPQQQQQQEQQNEQEGSAAAESAGAGKAKKVSIKEYLAEKLSPGEEDRALCEVISEVIQKKKDEERDVREEVEEKTATVYGEKKAGEGVVGKIKGAVTSLFRGSHAHPTQARGEAVEASPVKQEGGPRLQQSSY